MDPSTAAALAPFIERSRQRLSQWWECRNPTPILEMHLPRPSPAGPPPSSSLSPNAGWDHEDQEPDISGLVAQQTAGLSSLVYGGDAIPSYAHNWGVRRSAPMTLSFYYGASLHFSVDTTWTDHFVKNLDDFNPVLDPGNRWWQYSRRIIAEQHRQGLGVIHPCVPGIGDVMTNLSVMRGSGPLCQDLIDVPDRVHALRETMVRDWIACYRGCVELGQGEGRCPGTCAWTGWAPGTTYPVQCDFSTMISNRMFRQFVLPELEFLSGHLSHMIWHLDGEEEFKHLDTLLALPCIKAIQWALPPNTAIDDPRWIAMYQRVQRAGKSLLLYGRLPEVRRLLERLDPSGLRISIHGSATEEYLGECERYLGVTPWL